METKWLEDLVSLAETRSFSRSAAQRHVTQPAFSRRIQALEAWAGTELVDRSSYPTRLSPAGEVLLAQAHELLDTLQTTRHLLRAHQGGPEVLHFAVPHSLAFAFFPHWLGELRQAYGALKCRLTALNVHDAVLRLTEGGCDLLIAYHHDSQPLQLSSERYEMLTLGEETLAPYCRPDADGRPLYPLPGQAPRALPFLGYGPGAYMARLVDRLLRDAPQPPLLEPVYETDMAEGLKAMALEGHGLAFLPHSLVQRELRQGRLVDAAPPGQPLALTMQVRIYRERDGVSRRTKPAAQALWAWLGQRAGAVRPTSPAT